MATILYGPCNIESLVYNIKNITDKELGSSGPQFYVSSGQRLQCHQTLDRFLYVIVFGERLLFLSDHSVAN